VADELTAPRRADEHSELRVVVGVDGSPESFDALDWGARQAVAADAVLELLVCWLVPATLGYGVPTDVGGEFEESARNVVNDALARVRSQHRNLEVRAQIVESSPAPMLRDASRGAYLLVVGSRGFGGFRGLLLGSVSQYCAQHAHCPVLIVRDGSAPDPEQRKAQKAVSQPRS
jgi:nucleotide-binding universal stress UspA family protein